MAKLLKTTFTLFLALAFVFSFTSCKKEKAESSSATSSGNVSEAWIWEGPDYETLKENPGKAEITISNPTGVLAKVIDSGELIIGHFSGLPCRRICRCCYRRSDGLRNFAGAIYRQ